MLSPIRGCSTTGRAFLVGVALLLGFALANSAWAYGSYDYVDVDPIFKPVPVTGLSGTFDIENPGFDCFLLICDSGGFNHETQDVYAARIDFIFFDIQFGRDEIASISLGNGLQDASVDGDDRFFFVFYLEHFDANFDVLAQLSDHGTLDWKVTPAGGTVYDGDRCGDYDHPPFLKAGILKASGSPIPEPSAALLFCLGFGVVGTATRKRRMH